MRHKSGTCRSVLWGEGAAGGPRPAASAPLVPSHGTVALGCSPWLEIWQWGRVFQLEVSNPPWACLPLSTAPWHPFKGQAGMH